MENINEHFDEGICPVCDMKINENDFIQINNSGKWVNFKRLKETLHLLYETDEIRHKNCEEIK